MNQDTWEEINMIIQDEDIQRAEFARDFINKKNVDTCLNFYNSAFNDKQKAVVIDIFCSDYRTENTKKIATRFLTEVKGTSHNEHTCRTCLWNLDPTLDLEAIKNLAAVELVAKEVLNQ